MRSGMVAKARGSALSVVPRLEVTTFRAVSLEYYKNGLSPEGARKAAGRFNRLGKSALYVAIEPGTAVKEYYQTDDPRPLVLLPVKVKLVNVIDITGSLIGWPRHWQNWDCNWRKALSSPTPDCSSWKCGDDAISRNCSSIIYPSKYGGGALAIFTEAAPIGSCFVEVNDPYGEILRANPARF